MLTNNLYFLTPFEKIISKCCTDTLKTKKRKVNDDVEKVNDFSNFGKTYVCYLNMAINNVD